MYRVKVLTGMGEKSLPALLDCKLPDGSLQFRVPMNYNEFVGTDIVGNLKLIQVRPEEIPNRVIFEMPDEISCFIAAIHETVVNINNRLKELEARSNHEEQPPAVQAPLAPPAPVATVQEPPAPPAPTAPAPTAPAPTAPAPTAPEGPKAPRKPGASGRPQ